MSTNQRRQKRPAGRAKKESIRSGELINLMKMQNRIMLNQNTRSLPDTPDINFPYVRENKVHVFSTSFLFGTINQSASLETTGAISVSLNSFGNGAAIAGLFDCYRIKALKVVFQPLVQASTGANPQGDLYTVIDRDDATALSYVNLLQYSSLQVVSTGQLVERVFSPNAANAVYSGSAFTNYARAPNSTWIDAASPSTAYYGVKYSLGSGTSAGAAYQIIVHAVIEAKQIR